MIRQISFTPDEHQAAFFIVLADALARARSCETGADDEVIPGDHRNCLTLVKISFVSAELSVSFFAASNRHVGGAFNDVKTNYLGKRAVPALIGALRVFMKKIAVPI